MSEVVVINGKNYTVYGTSQGALDYWNAGIGKTYDAWVKASPTKRLSGQVNAARLLDRQLYVDAANSFAARDSILAFQTASYELAGTLILNPDLFEQITSGSNVKKIDAGGGVAVEFFNPTLGITGRFPVNVQELIGVYLSGSASGATSGSSASGTSATPLEYDYSITVAD